MDARFLLILAVPLKTR